MKRSLLMISSGCLLLFGCSQHTKGGKADSTSIVQTTVNDSSVIQDTVAASGTAGKDNGRNKDSVKSDGQNRAIIHGGPEQEKVDSIKKAKLKLKK